MAVRAQCLNRTIPLLGLQSSCARSSTAHNLDSSARPFAAHPFLDELDAVFRFLSHISRKMFLYSIYVVEHFALALRFLCILLGCHISRTMYSTSPCFESVHALTTFRLHNLETSLCCAVFSSRICSRFEVSFIIYLESCLRIPVCVIDL